MKINFKFFLSTIRLNNRSANITATLSRYMLLVDDDTVKHVSVETNPGEVKVTDPDTALSWL